MAVPEALVNFVRAPFLLRTYANLIYLMLAFPLGLGYFVFLTVGLSVGLGLTIVWIGLPILALVFAGSWGLAALERQFAIVALGAEVPPMAPPPAAQVQGFWKRVGAFFSNPVTWKGMAFLLVKFPLGIVSFVATVTLLATSSALLLAPIFWQWGTFEIDGAYFVVDSWAAAWLCAGIGLAMTFLSLNLLNLLALLWRWTATILLGSERFAAVPPAARMTEAVALA
jgi:hypothetical protein